MTRKSFSTIADIVQWRNLSKVEDVGGNTIRKFFVLLRDQILIIRDLDSRSERD